MVKRREPKPIESSLGEDEIKLFTRIAAQRAISPQLLLKQIVRNWLEQERTKSPNLFPPETFLPQTCAVLFTKESLDEFSARVRLAAINAIRLREGNLSRTARRLKTDRSSLLRIMRRLQAKTRGIATKSPTPNNTINGAVQPTFP